MITLIYVTLMVTLMVSKTHTSWTRCHGHFQWRNRTCLVRV